MHGPTINHAEIRLWAEANHASPAQIVPFLFDGEPATLCFTFEKAPKNEPEIRPISWDSFFAMFDLLDLTFVYDQDSNYELLQGREAPRPRFEGKIV